MEGCQLDMARALADYNDFQWRQLNIHYNLSLLIHFILKKIRFFDFSIYIHTFLYNGMELYRIVAGTFSELINLLYYRQQAILFISMITNLLTKVENDDFKAGTANIK